MDRKQRVNIKYKLLEQKNKEKIWKSLKQNI